MDSDGDGVGDIPGIISRIGHVAETGFDAVWLSPIFPSPMRDFGYDVSDYCSIQPEYGTLADFDRLVAACHGRGLKVLLDFVPNHSSSEHPWFLESRSSRDNPRRDWYIWRDPAPGGGPPNNWLGAFGGPAWSYDEATGQYWMHSFLPEQPDLDWFNPELREAMFDAMRFWLSRGVDGLRVDVILRLVKDRLFRDEPANPAWREGMDGYDRLLHRMTRDAQGIHEFVRMFRAVTDEFPDRVLVGETYLPIPELVKYYGSEDECHLPFNFGLITTPFSPAAFAEYINRYLDALPPGAWPNWVLGNHDVPRITAQGRFGAKGAKAATLLLYMLPGAITAYYGDEIGMSDADIPPDRVRDPKVLREGGGKKSRDSARTPMQWEDSPHAGFSSAEPWLPVTGDFRSLNLRAAEGDPASTLHLVRRLLALRREIPRIVLARPLVRLVGQDAMAWTIPLDSGSLHVFVNFGQTGHIVRFGGDEVFRILASTKNPRGSEVPMSAYNLEAMEGIVALCP
jgi:alpha-glucosidase